MMLLLFLIVSLADQNNRFDYIQYILLVWRVVWCAGARIDLLLIASIIAITRDIPQE
jgi:hypothetical protein